MSRWSIKAGLLVAAAGGVLAATLAAGALASGSFVMLCVAAARLGFSFSVAGCYRFIEADWVSPDLESRALSGVMMGGVAAAFVGPNVARRDAGDVRNDRRG